MLYAPDWTSGLGIVSADGGVPEQITELAEDEIGHNFPVFIPGTDWALFVAFSTAGTLEESWTT